MDLRRAERRALAVSFLRLVLAVPLYLLFLLCVSGGMAVLASADQRTWLTLGISGFLGFFVSDLCLFKAFLVIGPRLSLLVTSLTPPATVLISWAFRGGGGFGPRAWVGMGITLAGVLWVVLERRAGDGHPHTPQQLRQGLMLALVATLVQAAGTVLAKEGAVTFDYAESARLTGAAVSALIRVIGAVIGYVALTTVLGRWPAMVAAIRKRRAMAIMSAGTIVGPCLGVTTYMLALKDCHEGVVTTILATIPVMILPFSIFLYGERVSLRALGGAVIAVAGVAVLMWP